MKVQGSVSLPAAREQVWELLVDPERLAKCLPGCEKLEPNGPNRYKVALKFGVAAISGRFSGAVELTELDPPATLRMRVEGKGAPGFMNGEGTLSLVEAAGGTEVRYEGEAHVGGLIASVGSRLIEAAAKKVIHQFFESAQTQIAGVRKP